MQDKLNNSPSTDAHISQERMLQYLAGDLSPSEQHRVEKHLLDCEICSDAVEGLGNQNSAQLKNAFDHLDQRIEARIGEGKRNGATPQWLYRMAAVIALVMLFGGGLYYLQSVKKSEKVFTENFEPFRDTTHAQVPVRSIPDKKNTRKEKEESSASPGMKEPNRSPKEKSTAFAQSGATKQTVEPMNDGNTKDQEKTVNNSGVAEEEKKEAVIVSASKKEAAPSVSYPEGTTAAPQTDEAKSRDQLLKNEHYSVQPLNENSSNTKLMAKDNMIVNQRSSKSGYETVASPDSIVNNANNTLLKEGIKEYEAKNYSAAVSIFNSVLKNEPDNSEALFYNGVSHLSMGEDEIAINFLNSVLKTSTDKFSDAAKWYLSLAYIKKNKISKAKYLLEELTKTENEYRSNALKTLEELK